MLAYILMILIPVLYMCILLGLRTTYGLNYIPYKKTILKLFFFCFFVLLTLRASNIGVDTPNYIKKFHYLRNLPWKYVILESESEFGFQILVKIISIFTQNEQVYLGILAAITLYPIAYLYSEESEDPILTMTMFLMLPMFGMFFSGMRQSIAIAFVVPAYYMVRQKKKLKFILIVIGAMLFHRSSFILFLLYPIYYMQLTKKKLIWIVPLIVVAYTFSESIFGILLEVLSLIYSDHEWEVAETSAWAMFALFTLLLVFSYVFVDESKADDDMIGMRNLMVLSVILQCFSSVNILAMRMNYYFLLFLPLLIPKVIWKASGKNALTCKVADAVFCSYFLYYFLDMGFGVKSGFLIFPYVPFWYP